MGSQGELEKALAALDAELDKIDKWSSAPHLLYAREMQGKGQLELDYQSLGKRLHAVREALPTAELVKFDACTQDITAAFGGMIIHASFPYGDQRDVMRGWQEIWRQLDNSLKGIKVFLNTLRTRNKKAGGPHGPGGPRVDFFNVDRDCA